MQCCSFHHSYCLKGTCACILGRRKPLETKQKKQKPAWETEGAAPKKNQKVIRQNSEHAEAAREQHQEPLSPPQRDLTTPSPPRLPKGELALRALEEKIVKENLRHGLA